MGGYLKYKPTVVFFALFLLIYMYACGSSPAEKFEKYMESGRKHLSEAMPLEAEIEFKNALQIDPDSPEGLYFLALAYMRSGGASNAVKAYKELSRAVELKPGYTEARLKLGELYLASKEFTRAAEMASQVLKTEPGRTEARLIYAAALAGRKEYEKAIEMIEEVLRTKPGSVRPYLVGASVYASSGELLKAEETLRKTLSIDPTDAAPTFAEMAKGTLPDDPTITGTHGISG
ncbi:MAG: tetratricopeptide repeat protein [Deltaproteobacteria bacterium]|nr:tetratricopeptide repeat protein [Deltaproteobacteria bacterium]